MYQCIVGRQRRQNQPGQPLQSSTVLPLPTGRDRTGPARYGPQMKPGNGLDAACGRVREFRLRYDYGVCAGRSLRRFLQILAQRMQHN
jgi:hypothetical protein